MSRARPWRCAAARQAGSAGHANMKNGRSTMRCENCQAELTLSWPCADQVPYRFRCFGCNAPRLPGQGTPVLDPFPPGHDRGLRCFGLRVRGMSEHGALVHPPVHDRCGPGLAFVRVPAPPSLSALRRPASSGWASGRQTWFSMTTPGPARSRGRGQAVRLVTLPQGGRAGPEE